MAKAIAGRVLIMPRGTYDANATYEMLDLVMYNNASWLAKKTSTGIEPTNDEYWHKMADGVELVTNLTTEAEGKALDASMGKVLKDLIDAVGADALRERLNALETDSETKSADIEAQSADIEALRVAIEALGNVDNATVRYISDEADENFDWIQVQDASGNWVNSHRAYIARYWFIEDGLNKGNLSVVSGGSITYGDGFTTLSGSGRSQNNPLNAQFSFDAVDLTNYDKITVKQTTTFPGTDTNVSNNGIVISVKDALGNTLTTVNTVGVVGGNKVNSSDIVLDVSNINEVGVVHIRINYFNWTADNQTYSFNCKLTQVYAE